MLSTHAIEVALPDGVEPTADDVALLETVCGAIVGLRHAGGHEWEDVARTLEGAGWQVRWGLTWFAEARRAGHVERATGTTRDEAFGELWQLSRLDEVEGCP